ncbi:MAG: NusA-like transcription termination signal-binding factor [Candidatus Woesearchaeota archaeon]
MKYMSIFESITHVSLRDCFMDDVNNTLTFIVPPGKVGRALGKNAVNIRTLERKLNKKIKVAEYSEDVKTFIKSLLLPLKVEGVSEIQEGIYQIEAPDQRTRSAVIGRSASNLRNLEKNVRRFFDVKEIKVV